MINIDELIVGTKKVYNCCNKKAVQIIADRANTGRIEVLKAQIKEVENNAKPVNTARNAEQSVN